MTAEEYHQAVTTHDERMLQAEIDRIPLNVNRGGKHYQKLLKKIYETQSRTIRALPRH